ncbi:uncharacterized protein L969DRAFT_192498 [Mixia osmundae IAM 14324]|uniref:uncharacterized protein n=1 Tax=Mixia osmundae (strain CBS 9802 / IAM 14324 / JCM 22182 / KY 12970) TaxID=764103 RepID=UPI0004A5598F|nr:uncharacterized protein L969DRAFT_192498 [Mixia osmundae IAM 14324]KEI37286.1 hypothetical protein L969DRAFT_192498 [Mixia osmundae IAM 14324]
MEDQRAKKLASLPQPGQRTSAQARQAYLLSGKPTERLCPCIVDRLLTISECGEIIAIVSSYVGANAWSTKRHEAFRTTDVAVADLPNAHIIEHYVRDRIVPELLRRTGSDLQLFTKDLFVARYDAAGAQAGLQEHRDGCLLSFSLLLNESNSFIGGGTHFSELNQTFQPSQGSALLHDAKLLHEGLPITSGERWLLVGFIDTVR